MKFMGSSFSRLGGGVLVVGALLGIGVNLGLMIIPSDQPTANPTVIALGWADMLVGLLIILALPVLVSRVAPGARLLSVLGFACLVVGFLGFSVILGFERAVTSPYLITHHVDLRQGPPVGSRRVLLIGGFAKIIGGIVFGIAAFQSRAVSRVAAVIMIASSVIFASGLIPRTPEVVDIVGGELLMIGLGMFGLQLLGIWAPQNTSALTQPPDGKMGAVV